MMFGRLIKRILIDKRARERMAKSGKTAVKPAAQKKVTAAGEAERKKLIRQTMSLYREKRVEYEKLDGDLRKKIDKAAREAFGDKKE